MCISSNAPLTLNMTAAIIDLRCSLQNSFNWSTCKHHPKKKKNTGQGLARKAVTSSPLLFYAQKGQIDEN